VIVRARPRGDHLHVEIADNGAGIPPADLPKLFQPFTQLDMSRTRQVGGVGVGLSISKAIIDAHGGAIGVTSEAGAGSTFWFQVPLAEPVPAPERA
jgi:signal transduction histidine kinase